MLDLAFERNQYDIVLVNEYDKRFLEAYQYARLRLGLNHRFTDIVKKVQTTFSRNRGKKEIEKKLMTLEREKKNLVGFIGGPPCPDFSVAGKNRGSEGEHGKLTKTYFDIICRNRPDFFVFENVKGLVKTEKHKRFYNEMQKKLFAK